MTRPLLFHSLVLLFYLTAIPSRTCADPQTDAKHLSTFFDEHKGASIHGHGVHEKRKRGGRNYLLKRCNASEHSHASKPLGSWQGSADANSASPGESKKWGLAWPNGDASYLVNFARPKVRLFERSFQLSARPLTPLLVYIPGAHIYHPRPPSTD